mgnify:CR=1 FL=1
MLVCCFNPRSVNNIHHAFISLGCKVVNLSFDWSYNNKTDKAVNELSQSLEVFKPDFVYTYGWWDIGIDMEKFVQPIRKKNILHIYWAYDDPVCFENISMPMAEKTDLIFTTVEECIPEYRKRGIKAYLQIHGCNMAEHMKINPRQQYTHDLVMLGNNYNITEDPAYFKHRIDGMENIIKPLVENSYDLKVWGLWWTNWDRGYVLPHEFYGGVLKKGRESEVYSSCKIALGLQTVGNSKTHFSVRTFEVMGCGAFHLSQYSPALSTYFEKGIHLEWTRSADETLELVNFYLNRDSKRDEIARRGRQEVYEKHTIVHRIRDVLSIIEKHI